MKTFRPWMLPPLRCAAKMGFLSRDIWNEVIATGSTTWKNDKWRSLKERGLFSTSQRFENSDRILVLTEKGRRLAASFKFNPVAPPLSDYVPHDEMVTEYALKLEAEGLIDGWRSEQEIRQSNYQHQSGHSGVSKTSKFPDLIVKLAIPGQPSFMAVEFEKTRKSSERYNEFVRKYMTLQDVDTVIILVSHQVIIDSIKRAQVRTSYPQHLRPFSFGLISEALANPGQAPLNYDGKSVNLETTVSAIRQKRNLSEQKSSKNLQRHLRFENGTSNE